MHPKVALVVATVYGLSHVLVSYKRKRRETEGEKYNNNNNNNVSYSLWNKCSKICTNSDIHIIHHKINSQMDFKNRRRG